MTPTEGRATKKKERKKKQGVQQRNSIPCFLTSSVTMIRGYLSSDRKLKMHQILKASSLQIFSSFCSRFFLYDNVQHILLKSWRLKLSFTCGTTETSSGYVPHQRRTVCFSRRSHFLKLTFQTTEHRYYTYGIYPFIKSIIHNFNNVQHAFHLLAHAHAS